MWNDWSAETKLLIWISTGLGGLLVVLFVIGVMCYRCCNNYKENFINIVILCFSPVNTLEKVYIPTDVTYEDKRQERTQQKVVVSYAKKREEPTPQTGANSPVDTSEEVNISIGVSYAGERGERTPQQGAKNKKIKNIAGSYLVYHDRVIDPNDTFGEAIGVFAVFFSSICAVFFGIVGSQYEIISECQYTARYSGSVWECFQGQTMKTYNCNAEFASSVQNSFDKMEFDNDVVCVRWQFDFVLLATMSLTLYRVTFLLLKICEEIYNAMAAKCREWTVIFPSAGLLLLIFLIMYYFYKCHHHKFRKRFYYSFPVCLPVVIAMFTRHVGTYTDDTTAASSSCCCKTRSNVKAMDTRSFEQKTLIESSPKEESKKKQEKEERENLQKIIKEIPSLQKKLEELIKKFPPDQHQQPPKKPATSKPTLPPPPPPPPPLLGTEVTEVIDESTSE